MDDAGATVVTDGAAVYAPIALQYNIALVSSG